jgi:dihydroorotase
VLSWQPARIAQLDGEHGGPVVPGRPANLTVFDPAAEWTVDPARLASRSRNTPYAGRTLTGKVRHTIFRGEPVVVDSEAQR